MSRCGCSYPPPPNHHPPSPSSPENPPPLPTLAKWLNPPHLSRSPEFRAGRAGPHQLLEGGLVQVTLESELAERFPWRLVRLHLDCTALHGALVADGAARHQGRPGQSLQALRDKQKRGWKTLELGLVFPAIFETGAPGTGT